MTPAAKSGIRMKKPSSSAARAAGMASTGRYAENCTGSECHPGRTRRHRVSSRPPPGCNCADVVATSAQTPQRERNCRRVVAAAWTRRTVFLTRSRKGGCVDGMPTTTAGTLEERLRSVGLRVTAPRLAVLRELEHHAHADVDTLVGAVRERHHAVSTQAVYDVLRVLTAHGLTRRIEPSGSPARFENRVGDNHHHVVCRSCGAIARRRLRRRRGALSAAERRTRFHRRRGRSRVLGYVPRMPSPPAYPSATHPEGEAMTDTTPPSRSRRHRARRPSSARPPTTARRRSATATA